MLHRPPGEVRKKLVRLAVDQVSERRIERMPGGNHLASSRKGRDSAVQGFDATESLGVDGQETRKCVRKQLLFPLLGPLLNLCTHRELADHGKIFSGEGAGISQN